MENKEIYDIIKRLNSVISIVDYCEQNYVFTRCFYDESYYKSDEYKVSENLKAAVRNYRKLLFSELGERDFIDSKKQEKNNE